MMIYVSAGYGKTLGPNHFHKEVYLSKFLLCDAVVPTQFSVGGLQLVSLKRSRLIKFPDLLGIPALVSGTISEATVSEKDSLVIFCEIALWRILLCCHFGRSDAAD